MSFIKSLYGEFIQSSGVSTDTRTLKDNALFFALKGENFDGNLYAMDALKKGARLVISDDTGHRGKTGILYVEESLMTLQELAAYHRKQWGGIVFAITGSNGKTTTKELTAGVLSGKFKLLATEGNLNNHIGVPLTLLNLQHEELAVIEMGANHQGEIARLCEIAAPDAGMITNIGKAHMEGFGGIKGIEKGKGEMFDYLAARGGTGIVNFSSEVLKRMAIERNLKTYTYGQDPSLDVCGELTEPDVAPGETEGEQSKTGRTNTVRIPADDGQVLNGYFRVSGKQYALRAQLFGDYNFQNMLAAAAVGVYYGVHPDHITASVASYRSDNNRSQVLQGKSNTIIQDAYNANPTSMSLAIRSFLDQGSAKKMAILGDMLEIGESEQEEHRNILNLLQQYHIERALLVGERFLSLEGSGPGHFRFFASIEACMEDLKKDPPTGFTILLKGSRKNQLEMATKLLLDC